MATITPTPPDMTTDRRVFRCAVLIGALAMLMLVFQMIGRSGLPPVYFPVIFWAEIVAEISVVATIAFAGPLALREMNERRQATVSAREASRQIEALFKMADMLQSALSYADANAVLRSTAASLLPGFGGALYVFNNSGDRLELSTAWGWSEDNLPIDTIAPSQCWALKRGKHHLNMCGSESLRCEHHADRLTSLEIPMIARGEIFGLLDVQGSGVDAEASLLSIEPVAAALADAMSLALSNIALREKLRTQALRDPLTGLYNRRYMEDVLDRYANLAVRNESPLTVIMIDLDHFKHLNDEHGHAFGDAILSQVAGTIMGSIRPCDVACRYGGEELVVLLPDCTISEGMAKAELLRARIERISESHDARITASLGVATIPESSSKVGDILTDADAALYRAKAEGRNRVISALDRPIKGVGKTLSVAAA